MIKLISSIYLVFTLALASLAASASAAIARCNWTGRRTSLLNDREASDGIFCPKTVEAFYLKIYNSMQGPINLVIT